MANKQTRAYRKLGLSTKVVKGFGYAQTKPFEKFKGKLCVTSFKDKEKNPENKRTSRWMGGRRSPISAKFNEITDY